MPQPIIAHLLLTWPISPEPPSSHMVVVPTFFPLIKEMMLQDGAARPDFPGVFWYHSLCA